MSRLSSWRDDDGGWAMVVVLGTMTVLSLLVALALGSASRALATSRHGQDSYAALSAAQAGVQHYLEQLNRNTTYYQLTAPATPISGDPGGMDAANPALRIDATAQPPAAKVVRVTGSGEQSFRYQVLTTAAQTSSTGRVVLRSVGRSRGVERTVQVSFTNESIFKYLYYTEFETVPPLIAGKDPVVCTALSHTQHGQTSARPAGSCTDVSFVSADDLSGPVHTEDRIQISGAPQFHGTVETGWDDPAGQGWVLAPSATSGTPVFDQGKPVHQDFPFPKYNREIRAQAASGNGCLYTGPTRILFNRNATMTVTSPWSSATGSCGSFTPANNYTATVPVKNNGVVWVDKSTSTTCTIDEERAFLRFPIAGDDALVGGSSPIFHNCAAGTVFVEGWVSGQTTLGAEDNVFVTGNLRYASGWGTTAGTTAAVAADTGGTDVLGLYANSGYVAVYHPATCTTADRDTTQYGNYMCKPGTGSNVSATAETAITTGPSRPTAYPMASVQIDAAIVSPRAFLVANHNMGAQLGTLHLIGAIIQRFRGPVGVSSSGTVVSGFAKKYTYDGRLKSIPPPYLADTTATAWGVTQFAEIG